MADEIAQVCELEFKGITLAVKGTVEAAQMLARMLRALFRLGKNAYQWKTERNLNLKGEKQVDEIFQLSQDGPPQILNIRESDVEELLRLAEQNGLHWASTIDFIPGDGLAPFMITMQEAPVWGALYKALTSKRMAEDEKTVNEYDRLLAEEKEKLLNADPEGKNAIETKIENLTQAKEEAGKWVAYGENVLANDDITMSITDYLRQAKGTEFEVNPEKAMAEYEKGVEIGSKLSAKECFQPVRDKSYMPDTQLMFYFPDHGAIVTRKFELDQETGLVYSEYALKSPDGEIHQFSDRNMTKEQWNADILPGMLEQAGMIEGTECCLFDSQEKLTLYMNYHNKVRPQSEINVENAVKEGKEVFIDAEVRDEIVNAVSERMKGLAFAEIENDRIKIAVDPERVTRDGGKLRLKLNDNEDLYFSGLKGEGVKNGQMVFEIEKDSTPFYVKHERSQEHFGTDKIIQSGILTMEECSQKIKAAEATAKSSVPVRQNHK